MENKIQLGAVLYVYDGLDALPSIDFDCLRVLCLVKFTAFPVQIATRANPFYSANGKLPYLQVGNKKYCGYGDIKKFLDHEGFAVDKHLQGEVSRLSFSYNTRIYNELHACFLYYMFCEDFNFDTTRSLYAKRTPFPFNFYYPGTYLKEAHNVVMSLTGFDTFTKLDQAAEDKITLPAKQFLNLLERKLGTNRWFFGDVFSEFDATAYAYVALLHEGTIPKNPLKNHIKGCPNLLRYIHRISREIFKREIVNTSKQTKPPTCDSSLTPTERYLVESEWKTKILAGLGAIVAMASFLAWRVSVKRVNVSRQGYGYEFDNEDFEEDD